MSTRDPCLSGGYTHPRLRIHPAAPPHAAVVTDPQPIPVLTETHQAEP